MIDGPWGEVLTPLQSPDQEHIDALIDIGLVGIHENTLGNELVLPLTTSYTLAQLSDDLDDNFIEVMGKRIRLLMTTGTDNYTYYAFGMGFHMLDIASSDMIESAQKTGDILMGNYQQQKDIIKLTKVKVR